MRKSAMVCDTPGCRTITCSLTCKSCMDAVDDSGRKPSYRQYDPKGNHMGYVYYPVMKQAAAEDITAY